MDKLEPLPDGPCKIINYHTEVPYELLTQGRKTIHTQRNHLIPDYFNELLLFPHIQSGNEQNPEINHDSDRSDMIQNDLYTSYDISGIHHKVFDDDSFCNIDDDQS